MREAAQARTRRLARDEPAKFAERRRRLEAELEKFQQMMEKPKNN
jgi:hypothetical protein